MKKFEFLEHTADVKFRAYGKNLEEAFKNTALALKETVTESKVKKVIEKKIKVNAEDKKALLYEFLEEFLFLIDSEEFILSEVKELKIKKNKEWELNAIIFGDNKIKEYEINTHVKAITYQEMMIKEKKGKVMIQVIIDI